ncbi:helix-turn-helix domain-containing protein [Agromyces laixinhei]|uniref:helix-turn-helix domain-containing protein n=1 Tax=Agromyces laixinhei TaxID=2585717 RepID=UPI001115D630
MGRIRRASPAELVDEWPDGTATDPIARVAQEFAQNLREAMGDLTVRSVARSAGLDHATVLAILAGRTWPDLATIGKLERALEQNLWPTGVSFDR